MRVTFLRFVLLVTAVTVARPALAQGQAPAARAERPAMTMPTVATPFLSGVPSGTASSDTLSLSIEEAIARALEHNLGALTAGAAVDRSNGTRLTTLSQLLPHVSGHVAETRQKVNLEVFGFPLPEGIPPIVGPFNVFDARLFASQTILDLRARSELREDSHNVAAAQYLYKSARDLVVLVTANLYLQTLAASARVESVQAQVQTAQAIYDQAVDMKQNGLVAGIDVLRAEVQLRSMQGRATGASSDFEKSKLQLARVIGLPIGQAFTLSDQLPTLPAPEMTLDEALDRAYKTRPDYQAALERVRAAEAARQAAFNELLPTVSVNADYGNIGLSVGQSQTTYAVVGTVNVPIFQGGRARGRLAEAEADLRNRRSEAEDLRAGIYYDVRSAFLDLYAGADQLSVATKARDLAGQQLTQSRDRFSAGVADNIEVVQAQEAVALSSEQYIAALYNFNVAKALLARGLGIAEEAVKRFLGGNP